MNKKITKKYWETKFLMQWTSLREAEKYKFQNFIAIQVKTSVYNVAGLPTLVLLYFRISGVWMFAQLHRMYISSNYLQFSILACFLGGYKVYRNPLCPYYWQYKYFTFQITISKSRPLDGLLPSVQTPEGSVWPALPWVLLSVGRQSQDDRLLDCPRLDDPHPGPGHLLSHHRHHRTASLRLNSPQNSSTDCSQVRWAQRNFLESDLVDIWFKPS